MKALNQQRTIVQVQAATKIYESGDAKIVALADLSFALRAGELAGVLGPSGSGKTTLLMIAGLLERPTRGEVRYGNEIVAGPATDLNRLRSFRRTKIGFVFQKAHLIPFLTAVENVQIALEINDVADRAARRRARELLGDLGMAQRLDNYPSQLSGGEQQRVSIARALANDPMLILADEPTAALEAARSQQVMELFRTLANERKVAVCVITHDVRWCYLFDQIIELRDGHLIDHKIQDNRRLEARLYYQESPGRSTAS